MDPVYPPLMKPRDLRDKALALHDAALHSIHRIEALAGLMTAAAGSRDSPLDGREIEEATSIIREETNRVRGAFASMRRLVDSA